MTMRQMTQSRQVGEIRKRKKGYTNGGQVQREER